MTPTEAAHKMMSERGYLVCACYAESICEPGDVEQMWAGARIEGHRIKLTELTTKKDWDTQLQLIFGDDRKNQRFHSISTAKFWRAVLEETQQQCR